MTSERNMVFGKKKIVLRGMTRIDAFDGLFYFKAEIGFRPQ